MGAEGGETAVPVPLVVAIDVVCPAGEIATGPVGPPLGRTGPVGPPLGRTGPVGPPLGRLA